MAKLILERLRICKMVTESSLMPQAGYCFHEDHFVLLTHRLTRATLRLQLYVALTKWNGFLSAQEINFWTFAKEFVNDEYAVDLHQTEDVGPVVELLQFLHGHFSHLQAADGGNGIISQILLSRLLSSLFAGCPAAKSSQLRREERSKWSFELDAELPFCQPQPILTLADHLQFDLASSFAEFHSEMDFWSYYDWRDWQDWPFKPCPVYIDRKWGGNKNTGMHCIHRYFPVISKVTGSKQALIA
ncbi:hypothetical protein BT63DRAFT_411946 [Microthyrium microscopicum]|uniref:Uncharacterized protein n=1 Tax=Microthyrium microscopicum TaxID=703497 RepID=A0A6A6UIF2_9PEZI|nr:hypothetical protein BT63DRAFT_411946 [Microthyrium microscopicum]